MGIGPPWQMSYQNTDSSHGPILGGSSESGSYKNKQPDPD